MSQQPPPPANVQPWRDIVLERENVEQSRTERTAYKVWMTANAIYNLERETGSSFEDFMQRFREGVTGFAELQILLFAGLEGARLKLWPRKPKWTVERVGDLIDKYGGQRQFWIAGDAAKLLGESVAAANPWNPPKTDDPPAPGGSRATPAEPAAGPQTPAAGSTGPHS